MASSAGTKRPAPDSEQLATPTAPPAKRHRGPQQNPPKTPDEPSISSSPYDVSLDFDTDYNDDDEDEDDDDENPLRIADVVEIVCESYYVAKDANEHQRLALRGRGKPLGISDRDAAKYERRYGRLLERVYNHMHKVRTSTMTPGKVKAEARRVSEAVDKIFYKMSEECRVPNATDAVKYYSFTTMLEMWFIAICAPSSYAIEECRCYCNEWEIAFQTIWHHLEPGLREFLGNNAFVVQQLIVCGMMWKTYRRRDFMFDCIVKEMEELADFRLKPLFRLWDTRDDPGEFIWGCTVMKQHPRTFESFRTISRTS